MNTFHTFHMPGAILDCGGSMFKIKVLGRIFEFEMHPYCGPNILNKRTSEPLKNQPDAFLEAASLWAQQGQQVKDGLCVWHHESKATIQLREVLRKAVDELERTIRKPTPTPSAGT